MTVTRYLHKREPIEAWLVEPMSTDRDAKAIQQWLGEGWIVSVAWGDSPTGSISTGFILYRIGDDGEPESQYYAAIGRVIIGAGRYLSITGLDAFHGDYILHEPWVEPLLGWLRGGGENLDFAGEKIPERLRNLLITATSYKAVIDDQAVIDLGRSLSG
jgi:hypothetical protein